MTLASILCRWAAEGRFKGFQPMCPFQLVAKAPQGFVEKGSELDPSRLHRKCWDQLAAPVSSTEVGKVTCLQIYHPLISPRLSAQS